MTNLYNEKMKSRLQKAEQKNADMKKLLTYVDMLADKSRKCCVVDSKFYEQYDVKRGLREENGKGVLVGLTNISEIKAKIEHPDGSITPIDGELCYRGIDVREIVKGFFSEGRFGFEATAYLLMFGDMPNKQQLEDFKTCLGELRHLPHDFVEDVILKAPPKDIMNTLARCVLTMYSYDTNPDDTSVENVIRQCLALIAQFPLFSVYGYHAYAYDKGHDSLYIHAPQPNLSTAENILYLLRPDKKYTELEAKVLDIALVLHAEHGGGNNSSFTTHVVTSSGTDTYSAIAAALCSLKGPKHGGANIKVTKMLDDIKENVKDWSDEEEIEAYLKKILNKEAFDKAGLIYGIGHAIYSLSDPRAEIFKGFVEQLSYEKGLCDEFMLYSTIERLAPQIIAKGRKMHKGVSCNVDFYSGFVYNMLGLPQELYTPLFATARIAGWSAHRIEELVNGGKIIRPAYESVLPRRPYIPLEERK